MRPHNVHLPMREDGGEVRTISSTVNCWLKLILNVVLAFIAAFVAIEVGIQTIAKRLRPNVGIGLNARLKSHRTVFCEDARERHTRF